MKRNLTILLTFIIVFQSFYIYNTNAEQKKTDYGFIHTNSLRNNFEDIIIIPDSNPLFGIIGSYVSCWYTSQKEYGLKPMIIHKNGIFTDNHRLFFNQYFEENDGSLLVLGKSVQIDYEKHEILGSISDVAIETATYIYSYVSTIMIISSDINEYQLSLTASPLASYLDIPIIIYDNNTNEIENVCNELNVTEA